MILAFDFETYLIRPGCQLPPGVCMSYAEIVPPAGNAPATVGRCGVVTAREGVRLLFNALQAGNRLVGAELAFDVLVSVVSAARHWGQDADALLALWVDAYEAGRVHDVLLRQKLLDLAAGCYRYEEIREGVWRSNNYSLADLSWRLCKRKLDKPVKGQDDSTHWRLRFGELDGLEITAYPPEAYNYALEDAIATAEVFIAQEAFRHDARIAANFPGMDPLLDEQRQTMAAVPLKAMSAYGLRTDPAAVDRLVVEVEAEHARIRDLLAEHSLVRIEYTKDTQGILSYLNARGLDFRDADGKVRLTKTNYLASGDPLLAAFTQWPAYLAESERRGVGGPAYVAPFVDAGLVRVGYKRDTKQAAARQTAVYTAAGKAVPKTDADGVCLDSDACNASGDPLMQAYADYSSLAKTLSNDLKFLRRGAVEPIHTRFEVILETGRTSSSKPNVQNVRRLPGIRECFVPRPGNVFVSADYSGLELRTLAQTCKWVLGWSSLADALNAGKDPHLMIAATILRRPYAELEPLLEAGDPEVANARTAGKGVNFGAPGGLGKATFAVYAYKSYRIRMTEDEAGVLIQQYKDTWPELPDYFRWINSLEGPRGYNVVQPWSGRLRAGATYCAACNSPFQGLGADVAKRALWLVFRACYVDRDDPLYGCRPCNFVHDDIMLEAPEHRAHRAALRLSELMLQAASEVMPDVQIAAEPLVARQWSKKAKARRNELGELVPWDIWSACTEDLAKAAPSDAEAALAYLKKKEWPSDVARRTVEQHFGAIVTAA